MRALRKSLWTIAAILALPAPAPAAARDVCTALQRIVASAREAVPFDSVRRAAGHGEAVVPGFPPGNCAVTAQAVSCNNRWAGWETFREWPRRLDCHGFLLTRSIRNGPNHLDWSHSYRAGAVLIHYGSVCQVCAGGGSSYLGVRFERRRGSAE